MIQGRIFKAAIFKSTALSASFVNVIFAATALGQEKALLYLSMLSLIQLMIPFAGFGLAQRLVRTRDSVTPRWRVRPWFLASIILGLAGLLLQVLSIPVSDRWLLLLFTAILLIHVILSEWVRAAHARQVGFFQYNVTLFVIAGLILIQGNISLLSVFVAGAGLGVFLYWERGVFFADDTISVRPSREDLITAFRVSSINQYYNIIIVMLSLLVASPVILKLVLVWRFNIFFNWQIFYWLRFGHKDTIGVIGPERLAENRRVNRLNLLACTSLVVVLLILFPGEGIWYLEGTTFDTEFFQLLGVYALVRTAINLVFPYEIFAIYRASENETLSFLGMAILSFAAIGAATLFLDKAMVILLLVEVNFLIWRLYCRFRSN